MDSSEERILYQGKVVLPSRLTAFASTVLSLLVVGLGAGEDFLAKGSQTFHFWFLALCTGALFVQAMVLAQRIRARQVTLTVTERVLRISTAHPVSGRVWEEDEIPRARIAAVVHQEDKKKNQSTLMVLDADGKTLASVRVDSPVVGHAVMQALDLSTPAGRNTYHTAGPLTGPVTGVLLAIAFAASLITLSLGFGSWAWLGLVVVLAVAFGWPSKVSVAKDGVHIRAAFRGRFVAFRDLRAIERAGGQRCAYLVGKDGSRVAVPALIPSEDREGDPLFARLKEAFGAFQASSAGRTLSTNLDRDERETSAWIARLRGLRTRDDYRTAAVTDDALLAVVEDPAAPEAARAAAAVALRAAGDEANQRIRIAAEASASPKLRVALEAATHDDDDATALALDEVAPRKRRA